LPELSEETAAALRELLAGEASVANPVDMLGSSTAAQYERVLPLLLADPRLDAVVVLFVPPVTAGGDEVVAALDAALAGTPVDKPVLGAIIGADAPSATVTRFDYPESAARALGRAAARASWLRRPVGSETPVDGVDIDAARGVVEGEPDGWLAPEQARALLSAYGIPLVPERVAVTADEAVSIAHELGFPIVVKSAAAGAHKTETGGVALDLRDSGEVERAVERIGAPVIVQPYLHGGVELLAGIVQDPVFGPLVAFGPGGVQAELIGGAAFRIAPLTDTDAEELVGGGKAGMLVSGFRGAAPSDAAALRDLVLRLGRLGEELPEIAELDLNPVIAHSDGCVAVDARVRISRAPRAPRAKTW
jgi:acyl-CoA synthetase (NDP forming)